MTVAPHLAARVSDRVRAIAEAHYDFLWRSLRRLGVAAPDVEDAAQQVLLVLMRRIDAVRPGAERAFLFGTAMRVAQQARKRAGRGPELHEELDEQRHPGPDPEQLLDAERARRLLDRLLDELPLELRTVLVLSELEELTMAEVAALLELPAGTVASRLRRARELFAERAAALKRRLEGDQR
jgi:RNA polymerase sigma-70 factor (ECF subfamily)